MAADGLVLAGYRRVSRVGDRSETLISPEQQAARIEAYAAAHNLEVEMLEPELDVSGSRVDRPILGQILQGIEDGVYGGIIVATLDRLSRMAITDALKTIERVEAAGGRVVAVAENVDAGTPEGRLARNVFLSFAAMYRERTSESFQSSKENALRQGRWSHPKVPLGYKVTRVKDGGDGVLKVDKPAAKRVRKAFEMRAAGASFIKLSELLDRNPAGARQIIRNRVYLGELHYGSMPPNLEAHEPIVDEELWEAAQVQGARAPRNAKGEAVLLGGMVRCAGCQRVMRPGPRSYTCKVHYGAERCPAPTAITRFPLEERVEEAVLAYNRALWEVHVEEDSDALEGAAEQVAKAEAELDAFTRATQAAEVDERYFAEAMRERVLALEVARKHYESVRAVTTPVASGSLDEQWSGMSVEEKRHVLRAVVPCVWVKRGRAGDWSRVKIGRLPDPLPTPGKKVPVVPVDWDELVAEVSLPSV